MTVPNIYKASYEHPIIFYDGVCNLCNGFVNMVIRHDESGKIKFCPLQEHTGTFMRTHLHLGDDMNTAIGLYKGVTYTHSDVLRMVARELGGFWNVFTPLYLIPKKFRDLVYNWIARNRYNWFGKSNTCMMPDPALLSRFIT